MKKAKHTPGPWILDTDDPRPDIAIWHDDNDRTIADCIATAWMHPDAHTAANARLIAAAPDLLAAITEIVAARDGGYAYPHGAWDAARAAIARATGDAL